MKNLFLQRVITLLFCSGMALSLSAMNQQKDFGITIENNLVKKVNIAYSRASNLEKIIPALLTPGNSMTLKQLYNDKIGSLSIQVEETKPFELPVEALFALSEEPVKITLNKNFGELGYRATIVALPEMDNQIENGACNQLNCLSDKIMLSERHKEMMEFLKELPQDLKRYIIALVLENVLNYNFELSKALCTEQDRIFGVAFSADWKTVIMKLEDEVVCLWDTVTGKQLKIKVGHQICPRFLAFSPDGETALVGSIYGTVSLWDVKTGKQKFSIVGNGNYLYSAAFSPDGQMLLTVSNDGIARLFDGTTGKQNLELVVTGTQNLELVVTGTQNLETVPGFIGGVITAVFSPDGKTILTGCTDGIARLFDIKTKKCLNRFVGKHDWINFVAFIPDGKTIVTKPRNKAISLWDVETGQLLYTLKGHSNLIPLVVLSPDGNRILTGSVDGIARLFDVKTGKLLNELKGHNDAISSAVFSADGNTILTGSRDGTARLWDIKTGEQLKELTGHQDTVTSVAFSPDGKTALTGSWDGAALLWKCLESSDDIFCKRKDTALENYMKYYPLFKTIHKAI